MSISLDGFVAGSNQSVLLGSGERIFDGVEDAGLELVEVIDAPRDARALPRRPLTL